MLLCRSEAVAKKHVAIYHQLISEWGRNCSMLPTCYQILKHVKIDARISQYI